jgi:hypothetical protein
MELVSLATFTGFITFVLNVSNSDGYRGASTAWLFASRETRNEFLYLQQFLNVSVLKKSTQNPLMPRYTAVEKSKKCKTCTQIFYMY